MITPPLRIHEDGKSVRSINEIAPEEIGIGIIECVKNSISVSKEDLIKETARVFGLRATQRNTSVIKAVINSLESTNSIIYRGGKIKLSI